ncbi:PP2C family protein-serine/threonine phosphatase [Fibrella arboris]|uniref:PP2C family protein-serine/threonine phosphatase n=1 Tax=Fibrella arboris TaxID=3242486 RepID=UPI00351FF88E
MTSTVYITGQTDVGRSRRDNQDTFISQSLWSAHDALLVVIDGVGGYAGGAEAAALAKESISQYMATPTGDTLTMLREAVIHANNQIAKHRQQDPARGRMCCVLTAAVVDTSTNKLLYVHVGDTRLYRFRQRLEKLTHDHSLVGVREDANQLTEREAMRHPRRNEILRDIGSAIHRVDDPDFLESNETDFLPGDVLLLCSDGLTDMLTRAEITQVLAQGRPADEQIAELIRLANDQGGLDNITIVMARHLGATASPGNVPVPRGRTSDPPPALLATAPRLSGQPGQQRTWKWPILVLSLVAFIVLFLVTRRRLDDPLASPQPTRAAPDSIRTVPITVPSDSAGINNVPTHPDTTRQTR